MTEKLYLTWNDFDECCDEISSRIEQDGASYDYIVGLSRGGLPLAVKLSHMFEIPMIAVDYSSKDGNGDDKKSTNDIPVIKSQYSEDKPTLLVVDDICDTGNTMREVVAHFEAKGHKVDAAAMIYKMIDHPNIDPKYSWERIPDDGVWVVFPWES